jgi:hypothetical protein
MTHGTPPDTPNIRSRIALLRAQLREYERDIETQKLHIRIAALEEVGGDPKLLGANEQAREDAYRLRYAISEQCRRLQAGADAARSELDRLTAELEDHIEAARERRTAAQEKLADAILALASCELVHVVDVVGEAIEEAVAP